MKAATRKWLTAGAGSLLIALLYLLLVFGQALSSASLIAYEDGRVQNYPAFVSGGFLWTDLLGCGFPVLADPQIAYFSPVMRFCRHVVGGYNGYLLSGLALAFVSSSLLAFRLTRSLFAALFAGVVYGGSGYLVSELNHVQIIQTAALTPFLLLFIDIACAAVSLRRALALTALALTTAISVFAGHPQICFYSLALAGIYPLCLPGVRKSRVLLPWCYMALGLAIASIQILPSFELARESSRAAFTRADFLVGQLTFIDYLGYAFPYVMGGRYGTLGGISTVGQGTPPGYLYFGFAPLLLAAFAWTLWRRPQPRFFIVSAVVAVLLSLGELTPLASVFYHIPGFSAFRGLHRVLFVAALAVAMTSAFAIARLESLAARPGSVMRPQAAFGFLFSGMRRHITFMLYLICSGLSLNFLLCTLPLIVYVFAPTSKPRRILLILSSSLALLSYAVDADWKRNLVAAQALSPPPETASLVARLEGTRILPIKGLSAGDHEFPPNLSRAWGVPSASAYEPLLSTRYQRLLDMAEGGFIQPPWLFRKDDRAYDLASVRYITAPTFEVTPAIIASDARRYYRCSEPLKGTLYFENIRALPRFRMVEKHVVLGSDEALRVIRGDTLSRAKHHLTDYEPGRVVLLEEEIPGVAATAAAESGLAEFISSCTTSPEALDFEVNCLRPCFLVMSDLYYPGWSATIDGAPTRILRADYCFRAVYLPAGRHAVALRYRSQPLESGLLIAACALAILSAALLFSLMRFAAEKDEKDGKK